MEEYEPTFGNVYSVFDYLLSFFGGLENIVDGVKESIGSFFTALNPFT